MGTFDSGDHRVTEDLCIWPDAFRQHRRFLTGLRLPGQLFLKKRAVPEISQRRRQMTACRKPHDRDLVRIDMPLCRLLP